MYVAAPIRANGELIGVLTVGKPSVTVQPFVDAALDNIRTKGIWIVFAALLLGLLLTHWLTLSIRRLTDYARGVQEGRRVAKPQLHEQELAQLAEAMESMRTELEGKHYVEHYLHTLTHELKSPLAAIKGAAELLGEQMPAEQQQRFVANIRSESERLRQVVDQLLQLAAVEKRQGLETPAPVELHALLEQLAEDKYPMLLPKNLNVVVEGEGSLTIEGERFLLQQALSNLLDNAIGFSPKEGEIRVTLERREAVAQVTLRDHGPGIPDYAQARLFERFYSLPRPDSGKKGSGLGLSLVQEVVQLHHGDLSIGNHPDGGTVVQLSLPRSQTRQRD
jgi:two-component system sensor histidine kinase CreC